MLLHDDHLLFLLPLTTGHNHRSRGRAIIIDDRAPPPHLYVQYYYRRHRRLFVISVVCTSTDSATSYTHRVMAEHEGEGGLDGGQNRSRGEGDDVRAQSLSLERWRASPQSLTADCDGKTNWTSVWGTVGTWLHEGMATDSTMCSHQSAATPPLQRTAHRDQDPLPQPCLGSASSSRPSSAPQQRCSRVLHCCRGVGSDARQRCALY